jgi:peptidyl-prolyl cis-trans isomerase D
MFDLFRSRDKAVRILLGGLLLLVAFSMLTYLVPNYNNGSSSGSDQVIAEIGKNTITLAETQRLIQATIRARQLPVDILPTYIPQMVDQMVTTRAMAMEAERLGLQVSDAEMAEAIRQMVPSLFPDGKFVGKEAYAGMLAQQNMTIEQFESDLKRDVMVTRLRDIAMEGTIVTQAEIEAAFRKKNDKLKIEFVRLTADKYKGESQPTTQELQDFYKANNARYMAPEKKNLTVLVADQAKLEAAVTPTDADLQRMYSQNQEAFRTPERVKARHILLKTTGKPASEEPAIKAKAEGLLKQIKGGADFAKLAKENSEDGSAANGGDLGDWITHGQMVPEFDKAVFSLKPGETSDLVKTQYGYHIVQTLARQDAGLRSFGEVKGELAAQWKKQRANDLVQQASDKAQSALQKDPTHPDKVAADFNMQAVRVENYGSGTTVPELGASADFDQSVATLKKGEVSHRRVCEQQSAGRGRNDVVPPHPRVSRKCRTRSATPPCRTARRPRCRSTPTSWWRRPRRWAAIWRRPPRRWAGGEDLQRCDRAGNVEGIGIASYVSEGFSKPDGTIFGPVGTPDGGTIVAKVLSHSGADLSQLAAQRSTIRDEIKSQRARERNTLFESGVKDMLIKQGKIKIHQDVITRLIGNYRTS